MPLVNQQLAQGNTLVNAGMAGMTGRRGPGGGGQAGQYQAPDLQELIKKYSADQKDYSPEKMTEGMLGRFRAEMRPAMNEAVLGAQTHSARTGQNYADTAGRALGQATAGMAAPLGDVVAAGTELGTKSELAQRQMAQDMARLDATLQQDQYQFTAKLEADYKMLDAQLRSQERIAMANARSNEEIAHIQQQGQMKRAQFIAQAESAASKFAEEQKNWRTQQQLQYLGQAEAGRQSIDRDRLSLDTAKAEIGRPPGSQPGGQQAPRSYGSGTISYGGGTRTMDPTTGRFGGRIPDYQPGPGARGWSGWNQYNQPRGRVGTTQLNKYNTEWWR